jgi:hypothetical protein
MANAQDSGGQVAELPEADRRPLIKAALERHQAVEEMTTAACGR